jgi:hypothetical protein
MDTLREIAYILDRYKVRQIDVLSNSSQPRESRYFECYTGLREGRWANEAEMAAHFQMELDSKSFARFKNEVKKRLHNSVLFIDTSLPEFNDYNRAFVTVMQDMAVAKTLYYRGARLAFLELAEQILVVARKFEYVDVVFEILNYLKLATISYAQHKKDYLKYNTLYQEYKKAYWEEMQVREAYEALILLMVNKKGLKTEYAGLARELLAPLHPLAQGNNFVMFQCYYRLLDLYADTLEHRWEPALEKARSASVFFRGKTFRPQGILLSFGMQEASCLCMIGHSSEASTVLDQLLRDANEGLPNWFKLHELSAVNAFYSSDYANAWDTVRLILRHPRFSTISAMDQESWRLYQGYLYFLAKAGVLQLSPREKGDIEKFRLSSLLNNLPLFSIDKRGGNIPVLLLQVLFLLHDNRLDEFDNRVEALRKYRQRNLEADSEHFRTDCFIRLLETVVKNGYKIPAIQKDAEPLLQKMSSVSIDLLDRSFELEVVPYERQWRWVLALLQKQPLPELNV